MLVLQGSLDIQGATFFDREISEDVAVRNPTFAVTITNAETRDASLITAKTSQSTFWTNLKTTKYSHTIPIQNLFVAPSATTIQSWLDYVIARDNYKPRLDSFNVEFDVSAADGDSVLVNALWFRKGAAIRNGFSGGARAGTPPPPPTDFDIERDCYLINKDVFMEILENLWPNLHPDRQSVLLLIIDTLVDLSRDAPRLHQYWEQHESLVAGILQEHDFPVDRKFIIHVKTNFWRLFEFPLVLPPLKSVKIGGTVRARPLSDGSIPNVNFGLYHLSVFFSLGADNGNPQSYKHKWDGSEVIRQEGRMLFEFNYPHLVKHVWGTVVVKLVAFNGAEIWSAEYKPLNVKLRQLDIPVDSILPSLLGPPNKGYLTHGDKKLRGMVVSLSKSCTLKGTVVIQAKVKSDDAWSTVCTGKSDKDGNFSLPYPYGQYVQARALCSLNTNGSTPVSIVSSENMESISQDFIYILLQIDTSDPGKKDDCNCNPGTVADRLPSQDDLLQSNQFTQDVGGGCINLNVPNRTLREFGYTALVRHTDPDVANYQLRSQINPPSDNDDFETTKFYLETIGQVDRPVIDFNHPVQWDDTLNSAQQLYQAVTVSTGHVLHYKSEFKADGYSLGDLLYSLPLAPGQKKQIVTLEASHSFVGAESQHMNATEKLANSLLSDRTIIDQIAGNIGENMFGSSSASTSGVGGATGGAGSMGYFGGSIGVAGGSSTASSKASQTSGRNMTQFFAERLRTGLQQNAASYRQQNATVVTAVQEGERYTATTEAVANHNHCHTMTVMYFEVLRHFAVFQELVDVEECVFVPLLMTKFGLENIARWADTLAPRLLPMPSNTFMKRGGSWGTSHPLIPALDAAERVRSNWRMVDYPSQRYCDEFVFNANGEFTLEAAFPRPNTRYDNILSLPIVTKTVTTKEFNAGQAIDDVKIFVTSGMGVLPWGKKAKKDWGSVTKQTIVETNARIFDKFMQLDANYERVRPARCIRIFNFGDIEAIDVDGTGMNINQQEEFMNQADPNFGLWAIYARLLVTRVPQTGSTDKDRIAAMMKHYFGGQLIGDWDQIWYKNVVPNLFERLVNRIYSDVIRLDTTNLTKFSGSGQQVIRVAFSGTVTAIRSGITAVTFGLNTFTPSELQELGRSLLVFNMRSLTIRYNTSHYNGIMYSGTVNGDIADERGVTVQTPLTEAEKQNPRKEDRFLTEKLINHLNHNLEYYNRVLWYSLDIQRRFLLLDGFKIETFDKYGKSDGFRSLSSVLKNELISVVGNSLVFPVASGYHTSQAFVVIDDIVNPDLMSESLLDHYRTDNPPPPYRISIPTRGVYCEAMMGQCDACEKVKPESSQDWTRFTTEEPTSFNPLTAPVPTVTEYRPEIKDFATPMVQIQNAPAAPDPGIGLKALTDLMGKSGIFKDITGLEANQRNAIENYRTNQQSANNMAQMASLTAMANQAHNTSNTSKIMDVLSSSHAQGVISDDDRKALTKDHVQQMIDGGASQAAEITEQKAKEKQSAVDKMTQAGIEQNRDVTITTTSPDGSLQTLGLKEKSQPTVSSLLAEVKDFDHILQIKQPSGNTCWAALLAMMVSWKWKVPVTIEQAVGLAGNEYLELLKTPEGGEGLDTSRGPELLKRLGLVAEHGETDLYSRFANLIKRYGPLWLTIDANDSIGWSPHAILLIAIEGYVGAPETNVIFHYIDPAKDSGNLKVSNNYVKVREQLAQALTDADDRSSGVDEIVEMQIIHWPYKIPTTIGYKVEYKIENVFNVFHPVHEYMTTWALSKSKSEASSIVSPEKSSCETKELIRGIFWNDDPENLLFRLKVDDNFSKSRGVYFYFEYKNIRSYISAFLGAIGITPLDPRLNLRPENFNMIWRSHFGDLQFLHAMASKPGESPVETSDKILLWVEIMYKLSLVGSGLTNNTKIDSVPVSRNQFRLDTFFREDTSPSNTSTLSTLLAPMEVYSKLDLRRRALGSILHIVQDSYAKGHTRRDVVQKASTDQLQDVRLGKILEFFIYTEDDEKLHGKFDDYKVEKFRTYDEWGTVWGGKDAIEQCTKLLSFWSAQTAWEDGVKQWADEVFGPAAGAAEAGRFKG
ncbi:hypothetical protein DL98DRAFT_660642 [Cadophora sp. DSE1049]|nr:hypothetical protein DL98DRAFT_660642 [Cadophora sp. DSE1049]